MIRKVAAPRTVTASAGSVILDLLDWLVGRGLLTPGEIADAGARAAAASSDFPKAEKLAALLHELAERSSVDVHAVAAKDYVEDHLTISRVEPGALWFEGAQEEIGPLEVGPAITRLARTGWSISIVMGRVKGRWQLVEVGNVYPD